MYQHIVIVSLLKYVDVACICTFLCISLSFVFLLSLGNHTDPNTVASIRYCIWLNIYASKYYCIRDIFFIFCWIVPSTGECSNVYSMTVFTYSRLCHASYFVISRLWSPGGLFWGRTSELDCDLGVQLLIENDVIKWKYFPRYPPFVRGIHRSPVDSPYKGHWREAWCFLWSSYEHTVEQTIETPAIWDAIALIMTSLFCSIF